MVDLRLVSLAWAVDFTAHLIPKRATPVKVLIDLQWCRFAQEFKSCTLARGKSLGSLLIRRDSRVRMDLGPVMSNAISLRLDPHRYYQAA
jgi:hypothetical protein